MFIRKKNFAPIILSCSFCLIVGTLWLLHKNNGHGKNILDIYMFIEEDTDKIVKTISASNIQQPEAATEAAIHIEIEHGNKQCFQSQIDDIDLFEDITQSKHQPMPGKSIFFHVILCPNDGTLRLNARQACAIESAAKLNPNRDVFVLVTPAVGFGANDTISAVIKSLISYPNVYFRNLDIYTYSIDTLAEDWIKEDIIFTSEYFIPHLADYLRFLTLYKYGGIYFDLDVVVQKNLDLLPPNFAGAETDKQIAIGAMGFESDGASHTIIEQILRENVEKFDPKKWNYSSIGAITRVLQRICHQNRPDAMQPEFCWGFAVFPPKTFYAINFHQWQKFFNQNPAILNETLEMTKDSIAVHMWNKLSSTQIIDKTQSKTAYGIIAEENCPMAFEASGRFF